MYIKIQDKNPCKDDKESLRLPETVLFLHSCVASLNWCWCGSELSLVIIILKRHTTIFLQFLFKSLNIKKDQQKKKCITFPGIFLPILLNLTTIFLILTITKWSRFSMKIISDPDAAILSVFFKHTSNLQIFWNISKLELKLTFSVI